MNRRLALILIVTSMLVIGIVILVAARRQALSLLDAAHSSLTAQAATQSIADDVLAYANETLVAFDTHRDNLATILFDEALTQQAAVHTSDLTAVVATQNIIRVDALALQQGQAATAQVAAVATSRSIVGATARAEGQSRGFTIAAATLMPELEAFYNAATAVAIQPTTDDIATARAEGEIRGRLMAAATARAEIAAQREAITTSSQIEASTAQAEAVATAEAAGRLDGLSIASNTLMPAFERMEMTVTAAAEFAEGTLAAYAEALDAAATARAEAVATALNEGFFVGRLEPSPTPSATPSATVSLAPATAATSTPDVVHTELAGTITAQAAQIETLAADDASADEIREAIATTRAAGFQDALASLEPGVGTLQAQAGNDLATAQAAVDASVRSEARIRAESTLRPAFNATATALQAQVEVTIDALETQLAFEQVRGAEQATLSAQLIMTVVSQLDAASRLVESPTMTITPTITSTLPVSPTAAAPTVATVTMLTATPQPTATAPPTLTPIPFLTATPLPITPTGTTPVATVIGPDESILATATAIAGEALGTPIAEVTEETQPTEVIAEATIPGRETSADVRTGALIYDQEFGFNQELSGWVTGRVLGDGNVSVQSDRYALAAFAGQTLVITNEPITDDVYIEADMDTSICAAGTQSGIAFRMTPEGGYLFTVNCGLTAWQVNRYDGDSHTLLASGDIDSELLPFTGRHVLGTLGEGEHLRFYVDGVEIASVSDDLFIEGAFGFAVTAPANSDTIVRFYRIAVWEIVAEEGR